MSLSCFKLICWVIKICLEYKNGFYNSYCSDYYCGKCLNEEVCDNVTMDVSPTLIPLCANVISPIHFWVFSYIHFKSSVWKVTFLFFIFVTYWLAHAGQFSFVPVWISIVVLLCIYTYFSFPTLTLLTAHIYST